MSRGRGSYGNQWCDILHDEKPGRSGLNRNVQEEKNKDLDYEFEDIELEDHNSIKE